MKSVRSFSWIGWAVLVLVFGAATVRVFTHTRREETRTVLRIAHVHLEVGAREAFAAIAEDYMRLHPDVVIEQVAVPRRLYPVWVTTRLIGGTTPDLVELFGVDEALLPRHFVALGRAIREPNPYNAGTDLADAPWRDTFQDRLAGLPSYYFNLLDNYGIPLATSTVRLFYNEELFRKFTGSAEPPTDYAGFVAACRRIAASPEARAAGISPIAGSQSNADFLLNDLFAHQTQRLAIAAEPTRRIHAPSHDWHASFLQGTWNLDTEAVRVALELVREVGQFLPPGFNQLNSDDALFAFTQRRAVMIVAASHDARSIRSQATFPVGVGRMPIPMDPRHTLGPMTEGLGAIPATFAISRIGRTDVALDFLRFLTSRRSAEKFSRIVSWPSAIRGVEPDADTLPFMPDAEGYPPGLLVNFGVGGIQVYRQNLHRLIAPAGGVDAFVDAIRAPYAAAVRRDLARANRQVLDNCCVLDSALGAAIAGEASPEVTDSAQRLSEIAESQSLQEEASYRRRLSLERGPVGQPTQSP